MDANKNHIGTAFYFVQQIASNLDYRYTHGNLSEFDFKTFSVFPLCHLTLDTVSVQETTSEIGLTITLADRVTFLKTTNQGEDLSTLYSAYGYTENSNYAFILQQLYVDWVTEVKKQEMSMYNNLTFAKPMTMVPFVETLDTVLAGYTITLNLTITNPLVTDGFC